MTRTFHPLVKKKEKLLEDRAPVAHVPTQYKYFSDAEAEKTRAKLELSRRLDELRERLDQVEREREQELLRQSREPGSSLHYDGDSYHVTTFTSPTVSPPLGLGTGDLLRRTLGSSSYRFGPIRYGVSQSFVDSVLDSAID